VAVGRIEQHGEIDENYKDYPAEGIARSCEMLTTIRCYNPLVGLLTSGKAVTSPAVAVGLTVKT